MSEKDLWKLRQEIVLNSLFTNDYENSFGIDARKVQDFMDGYFEELCCLLQEEIGEEKVNELVKKNKYYEEVFKLDTKENLYNYYYGIEDNIF